jgi:hypothetical protein
MTGLGVHFFAICAIYDLSAFVLAGGVIAFRLSVLGRAQTTTG